MSVLIIDTSTDLLYLGLYCQDKLQSWEAKPHGNQLSKFLLPSIDTLLQEHLLCLEKIDYIAIGLGPGSFTGTRIGVIVAMGLCFALDIPHVGFASSLTENTSLLLEDIQNKFEKKIFNLEINYCSLTPDSSRIKAPEPKTSEGTVQ